jgi:single-strand DNA-binding protein
MNSITLVGRLTQEPQTRPVGAGQACRMRLAVDRRTGAGAVFVDIDAFGPTGEACQAHLKKGRLVAVLGRLEHDTWEGSDGTNRTKHFVVAATVEFLDRPRD